LASPASYVDRILRGAKPGDLAVQFPVKFGMVVNLKTAKDHPDARIGESREVGGGAVTGGIVHT